MHGPTRRDALRFGGVIGAAGLAACLNAPSADDGTADGEPGPGTETGTATTTSTPGAKTEPGADAGVSVEALQLGVGSAEPPWYSSGGADPPSGYVARYDDPAGPRWLYDGGPEDLADEFRQFIDETDFEDAALVYVQSVGPDTCHTEVAVRSVAVDGDAIVGTAVTESTRSGDEGCDDALAFPAVLVRVTGGTLPDHVLFDVTDGWDETDRIDASRPMIRPDDLPGGVRPDGDPRHVPGALRCDDEDFERLPPEANDVVYGESHNGGASPALAMRVRNLSRADDSLAFRRGEELEIRLVNVSNEYQAIGNRSKHNLQLSTERGWLDVRGTPDDSAVVRHTDEARLLPPGDGVAWSLELTETGVLDGRFHEEQLVVCPDLQPGRYRFAFWGVDGGAIAVGFDYDG